MIEYFVYWQMHASVSSGTLLLLDTTVLSVFSICLFVKSVLDLNAFERQNKAEGLGMVTEEGTRKCNKCGTSNST